MWKTISCNFVELNLDITLGGGQSFRWTKNSDGLWQGVVSGFLYSLKQDSNGNLMYLAHNSCKDSGDAHTGAPTKKRKIHTKTNTQAQCSLKDEDILIEYLNLKFSLDQFYKKWSKVDQNFKKIANDYKGIRILRQDPVENLFSFICSANNNIPRIKSMVGKLCSNYGEEILQIEEEKFYTFPTIERLAEDDVEANLRKLGFGYRAKYINQTAKVINKNNGFEWLNNLRSMPYEKAHESLLTLPGVGAKVADCICLMSLDKYSAIPVDTHIWQVTMKDYMPQLKSAKTLTGRIYQEIGDFYREKFGEYAGWANTVLFAADLKMFKEKKKSL